MICSCGAAFDPVRHQRHCSKRCANVAWRRRAGARDRAPRLIPCQRCGRPFWPWQGRPSHARRFCCKAVKRAKHATAPRVRLTVEERRECARLRSALRYTGNPAQQQARVLNYKRRHPEKNKEWGHRRRTRERGGRVEPVDLKSLYRSATACAYCGRPFTLLRRAHIDHIVAIANGGEHAANNLIVACQQCNGRKGSKQINEWILSLPARRRRIVRAICEARGIGGGVYVGS